jgi:hypothetical protein
MRCPNRTCRRQTPKLITGIRINRNTGRIKKVEGCPACFQYIMARALYTGRKIWHAYKAHGVKKTIEMNKEWERKITDGAAKMRANVHQISPQAFDAMIGFKGQRLPGQFPQ